ncbi:Uu.00g142970.m01.CDS01 [Anthostomella pinea]|uniref:Uu.00g142970.m01.CDS01 n=1 Tax=Anthostomella pinea TaxID=933095 RepID=A0AAI8YJ82_9PEZI|nr:Uu.00g142970.m01.CDS01 [Anthostomella pinea]
MVRLQSIMLSASLTRVNVAASPKLVSTGSEARFRGLASVSDEIAWLSGTNGTVLRSINGGLSWQSVGPALSDEDAGLEFRDIEAWSQEKASFTNQEAAAFYDWKAFESPDRGMAMSDPVDGKFRLVETLDGGNTWTTVDPVAWHRL